ncbi:glycoside hydrolase family 26 protein [Clavibacter michiganensis]|uniref:glycoside hydrolase family 26 protein n=1 Tax=Clavibacter michiganensis TaxID=28447 RepID=UPI00292F9AF0|nr:glycosyl hydrolase [Clavibacter michiganensis]
MRRRHRRRTRGRDGHGARRTGDRRPRRLDAGRAPGARRDRALRRLRPGRHARDGHRHGLRREEGRGRRGRVDHEANHDHRHGQVHGRGHDPPHLALHHPDHRDGRHALRRGRLHRHDGEGERIRTPGHVRSGTHDRAGPDAGPRSHERAHVLRRPGPGDLLDFTHPAPISGLQSVAARGADSLITWEPWQGGAGVDQAAYTNARIIAGDQDAYIRSWGSDLAKYGKTVYLRYGHEMNGNWYPWSDGVNGNASGSYVQAWKHVHDLVVAQGATNVKWVWSPNVPYPGSTDLASLYPGADQVDVVALDGYNWGAVAGQRWTAPADLFGPGIAQLRAVAPGKPLIIGEVASSETGGSKAAWDKDLVAYLQAQPDVLGFVWFDFQKEADWRIDSSAASATALREALALRRG